MPVKTKHYAAAPGVVGQVVTDQFAIYHSDCIEAMRMMPDNSVDHIITSIPFSSLYTYSNSDRDLGNCKGNKEFFEHYHFVAMEMYRILKPGRIASIHCMNLPSSKERDGFIGIKDFRGDVIRMHQSDGFIYHSEVVIWKDPVQAMQRTKAIGLLYKQLRKDSCISRQGIPDYLVSFRKPGENIDSVTKTYETFPVDLWQQYASPVWMDINPSETLQRDGAKEAADERHIAPLQLEVIMRSIALWTNPGDVVFDPFSGIGSSGHVAIKMGRKYIGTELKKSYFDMSVQNLQKAVVAASQQSFDLLFEEGYIPQEAAAIEAPEYLTTTDGRTLVKSKQDGMWMLCEEND